MINLEPVESIYDALLKIRLHISEMRSLFRFSFFTPQTSSKITSKLAHPNAPIGYGLCFLNLAFDGFTNATQDSITAR